MPGRPKPSPKAVFLRDLGDRIRYWRDEVWHWSQREMTSKLRNNAFGALVLPKYVPRNEHGPNYVSLLERGKKDPHASQLVRIADTLGLPLGALLPYSRRRSLERHRRTRRPAPVERLEEWLAQLEIELAGLVPPEYGPLESRGGRLGDDPMLLGALCEAFKEVRAVSEAQPRAVGADDLRRPQPVISAWDSERHRRMQDALARAAALDPTLLYRHPAWRQALRYARLYSSPVFLALLGHHAPEIQPPVRARPNEQGQPVRGTLKLPDAP